MRKIWATLIGVCLLLTACVHSDSAGQVEAFQIYFLDVGQGDCILVRTEAGDVLIDAGPDDAQTSLCMRLHQLGVTQLELAIFTHPDEDHIGGADGVLREFPAQTVWLSALSEAPHNECERLLWQSAEEQGSELVAVEGGTMFQLGESTLFVLAPMQASGKDSNESGIVLKLTYRNATALFTGDVGIATENALVEQYGMAHLDVQLLKVGHHGSSTSSGNTFLSAVSPQYAVISCAAGNAYGHPHGETLKRLEAAGAVTLRTDLLGEILMESDGECFSPAKGYE